MWLFALIAMISIGAGTSLAFDHNKIGKPLITFNDRRCETLYRISEGDDVSHDEAVDARARFNELDCDEDQGSDQ